MDIKPPKRPRAIDFVTKPKSSSDTHPLKQVSSSLKPKLNASENVDKIKEKLSQNIPDDLKNNKKTKLVFAVTALLFISIACLYFVNVQNFPQVTNEKKVFLEQTTNLESIKDNILFAPKNTLDLVLVKLGLSAALSAKLVSAFFALIASVLLFISLKRQLSFKITVLSTLMFASSTWVIFQARDTGFGSSYLLALPLIFLAAQTINKKTTGVGAYLIFGGLSLGMYLPGFIWMVLGGLIIYAKKSVEYFKSLGKVTKIISLSVLILPLIPLVYSFITNVTILKNWAGIPSELSLNIVRNNLFDLPKQMLFSGVNDHLIWLVHTPILDAVTSLLVFTGLIYIFKREKLADLRNLSVLFLVIIFILTLLNGFTFISVVIPLIYIFVAAGLTFLVEQWFHIFPRNPLARSIGVSLVIVLVGLVSSYHIIRYFIAWPRVDATKQAFSISQSVTINEENKE